MAFGAASGKHGKPSKTRTAKQYKIRPAVPPQSSVGSSGKATMQLRLAAAALVGIPAAIMLFLIGYLVVGNA